MRTRTRSIRTILTAAVLALVLPVSPDALAQSASTTWNRMFSGSYEYSTFRYIARKHGVPVAVLGVDQNTQDAILEAASTSQRLFDLEVKSGERDDDSDGVGLIFLFSPRKNLHPFNLCGKTDREGMQDAAPSDNATIEFITAYCRGKRHMASIRASLDNVSAKPDPRLGLLVRSVLARILPEKNPEHGRGCSTTISVDC